MIGTPRGNPAGNDGGNSGGNAGGNLAGLAELLATLDRRAAEAERIQARRAWAQSPRFFAAKRPIKTDGARP